MAIPFSTHSELQLDTTYSYPYPCRYTPIAIEWVSSCSNLLKWKLQDERVTAFGCFCCFCSVGVVNCWWCEMPMWMRQCVIQRCDVLYAHCLSRRDVLAIARLYVFLCVCPPCIYKATQHGSWRREYRRANNRKYMADSYIIGARVPTAAAAAAAAAVSGVSV